MRHLLSLFKLPALLAASAMAFAVMPTALHAHPNQAAGAVFTMSNSPAGNAVLAFARSRNGDLAPAGAFPTGGLGTGGGLGNQGALVLNGHWMFAVNAGSNELTVFALGRLGLVLTDKVPSGGERPVSVAVHRDLVYVLHAGSDNLAGFNVDYHGKLTPIAGSLRALSGGGTAPAQAEFSRDGEQLVVTEKATNKVLVYPVDDDGLLGEPNIYDSPAPTPFGFAFGKRDQFFVSEAVGGAPGKSSLSSYQLNDDSTATLVSAAVPAPGQAAACWVVVTRNGRFAYISNTGSGTLTGFRIRKDGKLSLLEAGAVSAETGAGSAPIDMALSRNSRLLFVLNAGNGTISSFRVGPQGKLTPLDTTVGLPAGANGLVAR